MGLALDDMSAHTEFIFLLCLKFLMQKYSRKHYNPLHRTVDDILSVFYL